MILLGGSAAHGADDGASDCVARRAAAAAADATLRDCLEGGGGCDKELAARETARAQAAGCPDEKPSTAPTTAPTPAITLVPIAAAPTTASGMYAAGFARGELDGAGTGTGGWAAGGFAGGCLLTGLGCLGVTGAAYLIDPALPPAAIARPDQGQEYWLGYQQGYEKRVKRRRAKAAFIGGTIATAIWIALILAASASASSSDEESSAASSAVGIRF